MQKEVTIAVSILTANFLTLQNELDRIIDAKITTIHFDVMDNHFVPNLSFGPKILSDICNYVKDKNIVVDCHLMVTIDEKRDITEYLQSFIMTGVNSITLHYEALKPQQLKDFLNLNLPKVKKGIAVNPDTPVKKIFSYLNQLDLVLIMSVNPGFGKQNFLTGSYNKIKELVTEINSKKINKNLVIAIDGGINDLTAVKCIEVGANYLVSGSYLLNSNNTIENQIKKMLNHD